MRIGVDVGGTNTDAVIMQEREVIYGYKSTTTEEPGLGIIDAVSEILDKTKTDTNQIESVMIGTTQFTNAFVENKRLEQVAVVRPFEMPSPWYSTSIPSATTLSSLNR